MSEAEKNAAEELVNSYLELPEDLNDYARGVIHGTLNAFRSQRQAEETDKVKQ